MKTAEQWIKQKDGNTGVTAPLNIFDVQDIQSDARHAALTEAANLAKIEMDDCYGDDDVVASGACERIGKSILALRDGK